MGMYTGEAESLTYQKHEIYHSIMIMLYSLLAYLGWDKMAAQLQMTFPMYFLGNHRILIRGVMIHSVTIWFVLQYTACDTLLIWYLWYIFWVTPWIWVMLCGAIDLGQHWLRSQRHQATTWTNVDPSLGIRSSDIHLRAILQQVPKHAKLLLCIINSKIISFNFCLPGAKELNAEAPG